MTNTYMQSLALFAVPANVVAGIIMLIGGRQHMRWSIIEYVLVYLTWGVLLSVSYFLFGGLDQAIEELGINMTFAAVLSILAGILGGLSLLPRIFTEKYDVSGVLVTSLSAFMIAIVYIKLVAIMFLLIPPVNLT